jgi:hypothetical protein
MDYFLSPACYTAKGFRPAGLGVVVGLRWNHLRPTADTYTDNY